MMALAKKAFFYYCALAAGFITLATLLDARPFFLLLFAPVALYFLWAVIDDLRHPGKRTATTATLAEKKGELLFILAILLALLVLGSIGILLGR